MRDSRPWVKETCWERSSMIFSSSFRISVSSSILALSWSKSAGSIKGAIFAETGSLDWEEVEEGTRILHLDSRSGSSLMVQFCRRLRGGGDESLQTTGN